ncbi:MAG: hypothetical protein R2755_33910 [Acidimicrobiales bacterium]
MAVGLKWPNDLFVGDRKLAGVLTESSVHGGRVDAGHRHGPQRQLARRGAGGAGELAVALNQLAGRTVDRVALAIALVTGFDAELAMLEGPGGEQAVLAAYRAASATVGRTVRLELPDGPVVGRALDVDDDGHIVVELDGQRRTFAAVDVTHLRLQ